MYTKRTAKVLFMIIAIASSGFIFSACKAKFREGMIISTQVAEKMQNSNYVTGDSWRYIPRSRIIAIDPANPEQSSKIISGDFYSARSPEISYDGKYLLFAAQQKENDPWQVWEMNLKNAEIRKVISFVENCTDPAYLPGGRLVFSKSVANDSLKSGHSLFAANLDGTDIKRITFSPHTYFASGVLNDGRVLTISKQVYPHQKAALLMVMRPDGTKSELFYQGNNGTSLLSRAYETKDRKIVFIESDRPNQQGGDIISINYNRPLHSRENLTSQIQGDFNSVFPLQSGKFLVSYRKSDSDSYSLYEFDPVKKVLGPALHSDAGYNEIEAVEVKVHERPKKLPTEVFREIKTGLIVCQDVNLLEPQIAHTSPPPTKTSYIEIMGIDSLLGVIQPEEDGSFYLKVIANKPFQIRSVNKEGHITQKCDWIWLRPNERHGCIGCHENHELVPENRIPLAVKKPPISVPTHVHKIIEKFIDTE
jgi:hypothetical protein